MQDHAPRRRPAAHSRRRSRRRLPLFVAIALWVVIAALASWSSCDSWRGTTSSRSSSSTPSPPSSTFRPGSSWSWRCWASVPARRSRRPRRRSPGRLPPPRTDRRRACTGLGCHGADHQPPRCQHRSSQHLHGRIRQGDRPGPSPAGHHGGGQSGRRRPAQPRPERSPIFPTGSRSSGTTHPAFFVASHYPLDADHLVYLLRTSPHRPDDPRAALRTPAPLGRPHHCPAPVVVLAVAGGTADHRPRWSAGRGPRTCWSSVTSTPPGETGASGPSSMPA